MARRGILVLAQFRSEFYERLTALDFEIYHAFPVQSDAVNVLVVRSTTKVHQQVIDQLPQLRCVITATHGTDHVDVEYLQAQGIAFYTVPVQSYDVAQGVIAYILAHATHLLEADRSMKRSEWRKTELVGCRITNQTIGIVGYGKIGQEVAHLASALQMNVLIYDPYLPPHASHGPNVGSLEKLLARSDYLTIHVPLSDTTRGLIGPREISQMKDGAYLINTARGGIVDERALLEALDTGKLSGAGLDVYVHQHPFDHDVSKRLVQHPHVTATPHSIGQTRDALHEKGDTVIQILQQLAS